MRQQVKRGKERGGLTAANFRARDGHEAKGEAGVRGAMGPPTIGQHHWGVRGGVGSGSG